VFRKIGTVTRQHQALGEIIVEYRRPLSFASVIAAIALYTLILHQVYTWQGNTHPDFYIEWVGSRVALTGGNPYSDQTTMAIQMGSKGRLVPGSEDQLAFVYPFYRVFLNAPVAFLPYDWATAIWQTAMQCALFAGVLLFIRGLQWRASAGDLVLVMLVAALAYPTFGGVVLGQMAVGTLALLLVALWAIKARRDWLAGGCLAVATVKPQLVVLIVPVVLVWGLLQRRGRLLLSFSIVLGILTGLSFVMFPSWLSEFVQATVRYPGYKNVQTGPGFLLSTCCGQVWPWLLEMAGIAWLGASWWLLIRGDGQEHSRRSNDYRLDGAFALTLAMTVFLLPQTSIVNQLVLLPAILLLMRDATSIAVRIGIAVLSIGGSWLAYATLYRTHYELNMALPPLVVLLVLATWFVLRDGKRGKQKTANP
jgi:hypothetical protein